MPPVGFEPTISAGERPRTVQCTFYKVKTVLHQEWSVCSWPLTLISCTPSYAFMACTLFQQRKTWTSLDAPSLLCYKQLWQGLSHQNTIVLYLILCYADDDMFRPLWAIFRSQKCTKRRITQCMFIGPYSHHRRTNAPQMLGSPNVLHLARRKTPPSYYLMKTIPLIYTYSLA